MSLVDDIDILRMVPMFSDFADDQLRLLAFSAESVSYREGMTLFDEGERADGAYVIAAGEVSLQQVTSSGLVEQDLAKPGCMLGESAVLTETKRPCRAVAVGSVRVIRIRRALFKRMMQEYPELARRLFDVQAERFKKTADSLAPIADRFEALESLAAPRKN